jgi:mannonate dehydratase
LNGRELAVASYLHDHLIPCLIGHDPFQSEDIWQYFYRGAYWRRGPVTMTAIAAIDMALWDIKGKTFRTPVYNLVAKDKMYYEPAEKGLPTENSWSTEKYLLHIPKLFESLRVKFGDQIHLLHDVHHRLTPIEAARLGKSLEPYHLFWLEDAVTAELQEGFRIVRQHTTTPLALGEVFNSIWDAHILITEQLIDYIRMTIVHSGGITHLKKVASLAELYHVRTGCHGATDLSPVSMAAALHFDIAINNFGVQEYMMHTKDTDEVFPHAYSFKDGFLYPGEGPGFGVDYDESLAARFPYQRAYLPVNRKEDGTMFNW